jgi:hypothetical protein
VDPDPGQSVRVKGERTHLENAAGAEIGVDELTGLRAPDVNTLPRANTDHSQFFINSLEDPDPVGSASFCQIRIRHHFN